MNQLVLQAQLLELGLVRYTPAGLMALDCMLKHESQVQEAGKPRKVSMEIKAVAIGEIGKRLQSLGVGGNALFTGFLSAQKNGRGTIFHLTALTPN
ncbi:primosomal replication protein N [Paucibacter sp. DJ2R-2]|uniref:primosomal replication protein N n=1 Tax=Paucibacter sp. DJ2R-2 TaxID=2893558 RepID=UPI0021E3771C|nr:primosomal replication protein N [Paucibacter sp. DJ2R-2]MCV2422422.1 primosomal replication protein N [Paucibacter sp. DJ4R-1]MCV2440426.1 primosomal replication protein N [Paucibacter sp. DJ2R-2]